MPHEVHNDDIPPYPFINPGGMAEFLLIFVGHLFPCLISCCHDVQKIDADPSKPGSGLKLIG